MSSSSRRTAGPSGVSFTGSPSLEVFGAIGRIGVRCGQVRKCAGGRSRRLIDAVANDGPGSGMDPQSQHRVDDVVVEGATSAGFVRQALARGQLDLEVRTALEIGL